MVQLTTNNDNNNKAVYQENSGSHQTEVMPIPTVIQKALSLW